MSSGAPTTCRCLADESSTRVFDVAALVIAVIGHWVGSAPASIGLFPASAGRPRRQGTHPRAVSPRVEAADRARIQTRADTAAAIATAVEQRTKARADLTELETSIATQITASATVMSLHELAEVTGIPVTELRDAGRHTRPRKSTRGRNPRGRSPRASARPRTGSADAPQPPEATTGNAEQSA